MKALAEADLHPDWVAGISIGAINAALIAGNPPRDAVEKLRSFWETITADPLGGWGLQPPVDLGGDSARKWANRWCRNRRLARRARALLAAHGSPAVSTGRNAGRDQLL